MQNHVSAEYEHKLFCILNYSIKSTLMLFLKEQIW
jgi:hypothetical protein